MDSVSSVAPPPSQPLGWGIECIDTLQERPKLACCYLLERAGEYAFIEAGTSLGVPRLLALLDARGIDRAAVRYVMPTHVHLDHAGGAGLLMAALPRAELVVHPRGVRHMVDPAKLIAGAEAVYGAAAVHRKYGEIRAVAATRVREAGDGLRLPLGRGELLCIDTPGHARHHYSVWDAASAGFFTGDSFGLSYREFDGPHGPYLMPTTTPVQFDPEAWRNTIERYLSYDPQRMFLTHYSVVENVSRLAADLRSGLDEYVSIAESLADAPQRHARLLEALSQASLARLRRLGCPLSEARARALLALDLELNAQGLGVWLDHRQ